MKSIFLFLSCTHCPINEIFLPVEFDLCYFMPLVKPLILELRADWFIFCLLIIAFLCYYVLYAPSKNFPVFFSFVGMQFEHLLCGCEFWHDRDCRGVDLETWAHQDYEPWQANSAEYWFNCTVGDVDYARLNCAHTTEGTFPEWKDVISTACCAFSEYADWLEWLLLIFDQFLPGCDFLENLVFAFSTTTSRNE